MKVVQECFLGLMQLFLVVSSRRWYSYIPDALPRTGHSAKFSGNETLHWFEASAHFGIRSSASWDQTIRHAPDPSHGQPWPLPQLQETRLKSLVVHPDWLKFKHTGCDVIDFGWRRLERSLKDFCDHVDCEVSEYENVLERLSVKIVSDCNRLTGRPSYPHLEMDESYHLHVSSSGAFIQANETWGVIRGMETLSQLVYLTQGKMKINMTRISDGPLFPHRGILLDTARHYISKATIIRLLETMAMNKMNVFHWHIVDDQSFPYQSAVHPALSDRGAYHPVDKIYTASDISEVIEEARLRGIRVIPEFDSPGHSRSWGFAHPELLTPCYAKATKDGFLGPLNPVANETYQFLEKLFQEILTVFKDEFLHVGGDEVPYNCWASNPDIQRFMLERKTTSIKEVFHFYVHNVEKIVQRIGAKRPKGVRPIVWEEALASGAKLHQNTIIQLWRGTALFGAAVAKGYDILTSSCWYLDHLRRDWTDFYRCLELPNNRLTNQWLGGEAAMWTEFIDEEGLMSRIWPRAAATAERLWREVNENFHTAAPRLEEHRCRMLRRGFSVGVASGPGYCEHFQPKSRDTQEPTSQPDRATPLWLLIALLASTLAVTIVLIGRLTKRSVSLPNKFRNPVKLTISVGWVGVLMLWIVLAYSHSSETRQNISPRDTSKL